MNAHFYKHTHLCELSYAFHKGLWVPPAFKVGTQCFYRVKLKY